MSPFSNGDILFRYMGINISPLSNGDILCRYMGKNMSPLSNGDILWRTAEAADVKHDDLSFGFAGFIQPD